MPAMVVDHMIGHQFFDGHLLLQVFTHQFRMVVIGVYGIYQDPDIIQPGRRQLLGIPEMIAEILVSGQDKQDVHNENYQDVYHRVWS